MNSLAFRAVVAIGFMIGFYVFALAVAGALLLVPYAGVHWDVRIPAKVVLGCVIGAGLIVWSILPRRDKFPAPGPLLAPDKQPRLFAELRNIAAATGQTMPREVFLVMDVNAWVAQRGGVMGFGSRRVMGLGLPLLATLTIPQMRAVLAHEFGHYHGGDTMLGPWVYKTRAAIGRTLANLEEYSSVLSALFLLYGKLFLRITHAISRAQEFAADRLAAQIAGATALAGGLKAVHANAAAFQAYCNADLAPVLGGGMRPPVAEGFQRFLVAPAIAPKLDQLVERALANAEADPYDTHPPLRERIAAVEAIGGPAVAGDAPAITLLDNVDALELALFAHNSADANKLTRVRWDELGETYYLPLWRTQVREVVPLLDGLTAGKLPEAIADAATLAARVPAGLRRQLNELELVEQTKWLLGSALCVALAARGWKVVCGPGIGYVEHDGHRITLDDLALLRDGGIAAEDWRNTCRDAGILDLPLAPESAATASAQG